MNSDLPVCYGPNSPFDEEERRTIEAIYNLVRESGRPDAVEVATTIKRQMACLEWLGETLSAYPSPFTEQTLGTRQRGLQTLVDTLSQTNPANFEFQLPTRALLGRSLVMAETNFYRLLRHVCHEIIDGDTGRELRIQATRRLRLCMYTKLIEEVLSTIACDDDLDREMRAKAVVALIQIWEHRLTYRVKDFFPLLEATWEARQRITAVGGTLAGTQEVFELFMAGCDPEFVEYFTRPDPCDDEIGAFREFLFNASTEELDRLARKMAETGQSSTSLDDNTVRAERDPATMFYEFFRSRHLLAMARRLANVPGPKRTAEAYVMLSYLQRMG